MYYIGSSSEISAPVAFYDVELARLLRTNKKVIVRLFRKLKNDMSTPKPLTERVFYQVYISPLIKVLFSFVGDTMPIWGSLLVSIILTDILPANAWPGLPFFINDGTIIVISFAFLSTSLYYSTRSLKINMLNVFTGVLIIISILLFTRAIGLKVKNETLHNEPHQPDNLVFYGSIGIFFFSSILYFIILVIQKYKASKANLANERNKDQDNLENNFRNSKIS